MSASAHRVPPRDWKSMATSSCPAREHHRRWNDRRSWSRKITGFAYYQQPMDDRQRQHQLHERQRRHRNPEPGCGTSSRSTHRCLVHRGTAQTGTHYQISRFQNLRRRGFDLGSAARNRSRCDVASKHRYAWPECQPYTTSLLNPNGECPGSAIRLPQKDSKLVAISNCPVRGNVTAAGTIDAVGIKDQWLACYQQSVVNRQRQH